MISVGTSVRNNTEPLKKVTPEYLYNALRNPKPEFEARIRQLRVVRQLNESQYATLKVQLPYFVCATFNPPLRKTDNFAYTHYFVIDIDHIGSKGLILEDLKNRIIDLHCFEYTDEGEILYDGDCFPVETFSGKGKIEEIEVSCIEPYSQVMFHLGYEFDENDVHDVKLLCKTFHIEIPNEYR